MFINACMVCNYADMTANMQPSRPPFFSEQIQQSGLPQGIDKPVGIAVSLAVCVLCRDGWFNCRIFFVLQNVNVFPSNNQTAFAAPATSTISEVPKSNSEPARPSQVV